MNEQYSKIMFFKGMSQDEIDECINSLKCQTRKYIKDEIIMHAGDVTTRMGIVLSGSVTVESNDAWGKCTILSHVAQYGFFAESYALLDNEIMLVDVRANEDCCILFLDVSILKEPTSSFKSWQYKILTNLMTISAQKNLTLSGRSFHTAPHNIRDKVISYLSSVSLKKHSLEFDIPFDRQQMADYLNVERTALSKELSKMKKDNIIEYNRNHFVLIGSVLNSFF